MRLKNQVPIFELAPGTTIALPCIHEVDGTVEFVIPAGVQHLVAIRVHQHETSRTDQGIHGVVFEANVAKAVPARAVHQPRFQVAPAFHAACEVVGPAGIKAGVQPDGDPNSYGRGRGVSAKAREMGAIPVHFGERQAEPSEGFTEVEVVDSAEGEKPVEIGHDPVIFDVGKPADMDDKLGAAETGSQFVAGLFDVAKGKTQSLSCLAKAGAGLHRNLKGKLGI